MKRKTLILSVFLCVCLIGAASCSAFAAGDTAGESSHKAAVTTVEETKKVQETTAAPTPTPTPEPTSTPIPTPEPTPTPAPTLTPDQKEGTCLSVRVRGIRKESCRS